MAGWRDPVEIFDFFFNPNRAILPGEPNLKHTHQHTEG